MKKTCEICGNIFETKPRGSSRKYCFVCSPEIKKGKLLSLILERLLNINLLNIREDDANAVDMIKIRMLYAFII